MSVEFNPTINSQSLDIHTKVQHGHSPDHLGAMSPLPWSVSGWLLVLAARCRMPHCSYFHSQKQSVAVRAAALAVTELGGSGQDGGWLGKQQQVWCGTGLVSVIC